MQILAFHLPCAPPYPGRNRGSAVSLTSERSVPTASWLSNTARHTQCFFARIFPWRVNAARNIASSRFPSSNHSGLPPNGGVPSASHLHIASSIFSETPLVSPESTHSPLRIMFLISDTGGGHRASAQALSAAFEQLYPHRVNSLIVDFWTEIVGKPFEHFPEGYSFLAKNPPLWRAAWNYGRFPITRRLTEEFSNVVGNRNFRNALAEFRPHLIVSVHPLTQFIPLRVLRTMPHRPPFVTVCTDLGGAHPTWFHRDVDLCFVPTDNVRRIAHRCGLKDRQLRQFGLPVRPAFWREGHDKQTMRSSLGLDANIPVVLIVGGGDGVGGVGRIASTVANRVARSISPVGAQIVVVCGKNQRLRTQLEKQSWPVRASIHGFVQNMSEWMAASDLIISKAGPGTIAEALIRGLPIILSGYLPGQEAPNVSFVTQSGIGAFSRDPSAIADTVVRWLADPDALARRARRAKALGRPNATYDIVREIGKLVGLESCSDVDPVLEGGTV